MKQLLSGAPVSAMTWSTMPDPTIDINESLRCPTCNAAQPWSNECRRCKSDLRLLRRVVEARNQYREKALKDLREGHEFAALEAAQRAYNLYPDADGRRLLASCQLLTGNWPQAIQLAGLEG